MKRRICVDGGHGGHDPGAVGPNGLCEKDVALSVAMMLAVELRDEFEVVMTREDDSFVPLGDRAKFANDRRADLFVSIHCNSGPPGKGEGFEVFTTLGETDSDKAATLAFLAYGDEFPDRRKRMDTADGDPDKEANFAVLRLTRCPAFLFELEFIHTKEGEAWLGSLNNQVRAAEALARGVRKFFGGDVAVPSDQLAVSSGKGTEAAPAVSVPGVEMISMPVSEFREILDGMLGQSAELVSLHNRGLKLLEP